MEKGTIYVLLWVFLSFLVVIMFLFRQIDFVTYSIWASITIGLVYISFLIEDSKKQILGED